MGGINTCRTSIYVVALSYREYEWVPRGNATPWGFGFNDCISIQDNMEDGLYTSGITMRYGVFLNLQGVMETAGFW